MLEIKLIDGSTIKFEKEYILTDDVCKDLNNIISDFIKIDDYIIRKDGIVSIKKIAKEAENIEL